MSGEVGSLHQSTVFQQGEPLLLEAAVNGPMHRPLRIYVDRCVATIDSDLFSRPSYEFISNHGLVIVCIQTLLTEWLFCSDQLLFAHVVGAW